MPFYEDPSLFFLYKFEVPLSPFFPFFALCIDYPFSSSLNNAQPIPCCYFFSRASITSSSTNSRSTLSTMV